MDNCILCGRDLYEKITFYNLFKYHYYIHYDCMMKLNKTVNDTFPFLNKIVSVEYLFAEVEENCNRELLFLYYGKELLDKVLNNSNWSICLYIDDTITDKDFILVTKLCDEKLIILQLFDANFLSVNNIE